MKNRLKYILCFVIGGLVFGGAGVYAATAILSKDISYDNTKSKLDSTNVQDAIDELGDKYLNHIDGAKEVAYITGYSDGTFGSFLTSVNNYEKKITTWDGYVNNEYFDFINTSTYESIKILKTGKYIVMERDPSKSSNIYSAIMYEYEAGSIAKTINRGNNQGYVYIIIAL